MPSGIPFASVREVFTQYILETPEAVLLNDYPCFFIRGEIVADQFIRFEHLHEDVERVCERLGVPFEPGRIGQVNARTADYYQPVAEYYFADTVDRVAGLCAWELKEFGYVRAQV